MGGGGCREIDEKEGHKVRALRVKSGRRGQGKHVVSWEMLQLPKERWGRRLAGLELGVALQ